MDLLRADSVSQKSFSLRALTSVFISIRTSSISLQLFDSLFHVWDSIVNQIRGCLSVARTDGLIPLVFEQIQLRLGILNIFAPLFLTLIFLSHRSQFLFNVRCLFS